VRPESNSVGVTAGTETKSIARRPTARNGVFIGLLLLAAILFFRPLSLVIGHSVSVDQYSQILIVPPISIALLYLEQKKVFAKVAFSSLGVVLYAVFIGLYVGIGFFADAMESSIFISLAILLFVGCCIAAFISSYGQQAFSAGLFPLCFLVCSTPLPDPLRERVITFLQYSSAVVTDWFFSAANIPFTREGVIIVLPKVTIEIAQECSGIRSSLILVIAGLVLGHLFLRTTWAKIAMIILLTPLTIVKNAFRIFTLSTLGMYVDESFLSGKLHHQGGIVFFAVTFVVLWTMIWALQKIEGQPVKTATQS
jgi:exosortase